MVFIVVTIVDGTKAGFVIEHVDRQKIAGSSIDSHCSGGSGIRVVTMGYGGHGLVGRGGRCEGAGWFYYLVRKGFIQDQFISASFERTHFLLSYSAFTIRGRV